MASESTTMIPTHTNATRMSPPSAAEKMAMGMVCVRPGILPASISVAPNSPSARANASTVPATTPGPASGNRIRAENLPLGSAQCSRRLQQLRIHLLHGPQRRPVHQRKGNHSSRNDRGRPGKHHRHANVLKQPPYRAEAPKAKKQKESDYCWGKNQRQGQYAVDPVTQAAPHAVHRSRRKQAQEKCRRCGRARGGQRDDERRWIDGQDHSSAMVNPRFTNMAFAGVLS